MTQPIVYRMESMTNAQRAELKMWIRRLESAKKCLSQLLPKSGDSSIAITKLEESIMFLEEIK